MKLTSMLAALALAMAATATVPPAPATAQDAPADTTRNLRIFVDCMYCDLDYVRTEMPWVDYMRDRADAQVHILVTEQSTGGGGSRYTLNFIGLREFAAVSDTLFYTASSDDSQEVTRRGLTGMLKVGLMPYFARTPLASRLQIGLAEAPEAGTAAAPRTRDPWNYWNFRVGLSGNADGQSQASSRYLSGSLSANRTTEDWKISLSASKSENEQSFEFPDDSGSIVKETFVTKSTSFSELIVKSLGNNFSAGIQGSVSTSTFGNTSLSLSLKPAIEYDFFPYSESSRRMLTARYSIGVRSFDYQDTTIYFKTKETLPQHGLALSYYTQETWGSINLSSSYNQYLHDTSFHNASIGGSTDVRLFKGFSFNVYGDYSRVRDQLSLAKRDLTTADVLLRQRELATTYSYFVGVGLSYRFGSIFNNIVNPRMGGGGGGGMIIMH